MKPASGKVYLVGSGPGDPGLLTLRGRELLHQADVLLYDALASDPIVALASERCERIFVGKRAGDHAMPQSEIEALMIDRGRAGKRVVRLKGGDPFLFGRGGEEAQALRAAGIAYEVVPGVTSAIAAPAYAGIPVTHRDYNTALTIVSGHEDPSKAESALDWARLADPNQTLVFLMAMRTLRDLAAKLVLNGLPAEQPAAVIANGTRPSQRTIAGTISTIADEAERAGAGAPAIVIVGRVVELQQELAWFERSPLFGKRVLVTRPAAQSDSFARELWQWGAEPIIAPTIAIAPPDDRHAAAQATLRASGYEWIVFTSVNGVRTFFQHLDARRDDARIFGKARIAAIGLRTSDALRDRGIYADAVPQRYIAEDLSDLLLASSRKGDRMLLYRAAEARDVLAERLNAAGRAVDEIAAYKTVFTDDRDFARRVERADIITFTSASTVKGFVHNLGGAQNARNAAAGKTIACIGPITAAAAREAGIEPRIVAEEYTVDGLIAALTNCHAEVSKHREEDAQRPESSGAE